MRFMWIGHDAPVVRGRRLPFEAYGWAAGVVIAETLLGRLFFRHLEEPNLIMFYLLGLVAVALRGDRGAAVFAAVLSVGAFDWFFVPPSFSFAVSDTQYVFTFLVMGLVGVLLSTLTARLAAQITEARARELRARALYELSHALLGASDPAGVLVEGARVIGRELNMPIAAWLHTPAGELKAVAEPAVPLDAAALARLQGLASGADGGAEPLQEGRYWFLPVRTPKRMHGVLGVHVPASAPGSGTELRATLETGANQIAIALDQARAREEADFARTQAESERLRNALLSAVSHDLRTPLTGIIGAAGSLAEGAEVLEAPVRRELAQGIEEEAERLNRLVTNLLHATRLDGGGAQLHREWTPLEEVIAPALSRLHRVLADHVVELDLPAELPLAFVDPVMLEQVFINLLENASKYTPAGTRVFVRAAERDGALVVEVEDEGPGLPEGEEQRAFDKFRRYHQGGSPGAGLGLAIVRGVIEAHQGTITATHRPGGGAVFRFTLPLGKALLE